MLRRSRRIRVGLFYTSVSLLCALSVIPLSSASAQLRRGGSDRGRLGFFGGRLEGRFNRPAPAVVPYRANPNVAPPNAAPLTNRLPGDQTPATQQSPTQHSNTGPTGELQLGARGPAGSANEVDFVPNPSSVAGAAVQSAGYAAADDAYSLTNGRSASELPLNRLPYVGPGVIIRLPNHIPGEVNYLVDNAEHMVVHPGEEHQLRLKGNYEVRFSRGITEDGRAYGEGRYTVTEGVYRFDVTDRGWELYRESDVPTARGQDSSPQTAQSVAPAPRALPNGISDLPPANPQPASFEETLPTPHPRSILER